MYVDCCFRICCFLDSGTHQIGITFYEPVIHHRKFNAPVSEAQPEDVVGVETQGLHRLQHEHVAYIKLHHAHLFSVEQHWIFNIFTNHLQKKLH